MYIEMCLYYISDEKSSVVIVEGWGNMMLGKSFAAYFNTDGKNIFPIHKFVTSLESWNTLGTRVEI